MPRLLKIELFALLAFLGGVFTFAGVRFWFATHRTVRTLLDPLPAESDGMRMDNIEPWLDKEFIFQRIGAVVILFLGISLFCFAVALVRQKKLHDSATS